MPIKLKCLLAVTCSLIIVSVIYSSCMFSGNDFCDGKIYTKKDLTDNYSSRSTQIKEVKEFINGIVPLGKIVDIEFDGVDRLAIFHLTENGEQNSNWDLKPASLKVDTLLGKLGWTKETLRTLKTKLDAANCISVMIGDPCNIGYQRSCMSKYYYNLFGKPIPDSLKSDYNDSCKYILYNDQVVLEYGGGAIGPQCFAKE